MDAHGMGPTSFVSDLVLNDRIAAEFWRIGMPDRAGVCAGTNVTLSYGIDYAKEFGTQACTMEELDSIRERAERGELYAEKLLGDDSNRITVRTAPLRKDAYAGSLREMWVGFAWLPVAALTDERAGHRQASIPGVRSIPRGPATPQQILARVVKRMEHFLNNEVFRFRLRIPCYDAVGVVTRHSIIEEEQDHYGWSAVLSAARQRAGGCRPLREVPRVDSSPVYWY
jgi:hypothetical protein